MRKMYIQPKSEIADVATGRALCGSVLFGNDPQQHGGLGGQAPKRRTPVF